MFIETKRGMLLIIQMTIELIFIFFLLILILIPLDHCPLYFKINSQNGQNKIVDFLKTPFLLPEKKK